MGKTEFAINLMRNWMMEGVPIGMFSMEMPLYQIDTRMIAQKACLSVDDIESADVDDEMKFRILESAKWHRKTKLCYDQTSGLTPQQLKARIYYMQQRHEAKIIIVDFLTLMKPNHKTSNSHEKFTHIVQEVQNIAKELNVAILMIAQLNRDSAKEGGRRPSLVDIRESGAIEEAIDVALFLHRRDYYDPMDKPGQVELIVDKNRHTGKRQIIDMVFNKKESRFAEVDYRAKDEDEHLHEGIEKLFVKR
jgi:replicative DNA helicase